MADIQLPPGYTLNTPQMSVKLPPGYTLNQQQEGAPDTPWQQSVKSRASSYFNPPAPPPIPSPDADMVVPGGMAVTPVPPSLPNMVNPGLGIRAVKQGSRNIAAAEIQAAARNPRFGVMPGLNMTPEEQDRFNLGLAQTGQGAMQTVAAPALTAGAIANPVGTGLALAGGYGAQKGTDYLLDLAGVPEGTRELLSGTAGFIGGGAAEHFGTPVATRGIQAVAPDIANAADATKTATVGALKGAYEAGKDWRAHVATTAALNVPVVGIKLAGAIETANAVRGAVKGAREALATRATNLATQSAADAVRARIAEVQASPTPPEDGGPFPAKYWPLLDDVSNELLKKPYSQASSVEQTVIRQAVRQEVARQFPSEATTSQPVGPIYTARNAPPGVPAPAPPPPPRVSLPEQAGTQASPAIAPEAVVGIAPDAEALQTARKARQAVETKKAAERRAATAPAAAVPGEVPAASPTATPTEPASVPTPAARSPQTPAPVVPSPVPAPQPAVPETPAAAASSAPAATPPATVPSPAAAASLSGPQTRSSPASPAPPSVVPSSPATQGTETGGVVPSTGTTAAGLQHYYPIGRPTHIPAPQDLGLGVFSEGGSGQAASGRVLRAENEKGYAAALWAYKNGHTDPAFFDHMTEAEKVDFMNGRTNPDTGEFEPGAIQHAKEMNNPAPKGKKYQVNIESKSILGENTLEFAKAHLRKLVKEGGPRPALAKESVERLRSPAEEATAPEAVEGMRQNQ